MPHRIMTRPVSPSVSCAPRAPDSREDACHGREVADVTVHDPDSRLIAPLVIQYKQPVPLGSPNVPILQILAALRSRAKVAVKAAWAGAFACVRRMDPMKMKPATTCSVMPLCLPAQR
jgi:hypothetical protein